MNEDRTIGVSKYVVDDINNIDQVRKYIRLNEKFLTDEQAYEIQTQMGEYIDPPDRIRKCRFCQHPKGYHYDESIKGVTQLPCNFTWEEDGLPVPCLCYGWCETKEEAEALGKSQEEKK